MRSAHIALVALALAAAPLRAQEPAPAAAPAYLDSGAAEIVRRARARKEGDDRSLLGYRAMVTQRIGLGLHALSRDRILFHQEAAARLEWHRGGVTRVEALGMRSGVPVVGGSAEPSEDVRSVFAGLAFDPDRDLLRFRTDTAGESEDRESPRLPIAAGSEAHYRFRSGDTTVLRFPDGRSITVVELVVIPRRAEFRLVAGSFWFDAASYGLVRAVFSTARPFDLELDGEGDDLEGVPGALKPVRAEIRYVTIEYGLQGFRWWLPRLMALEGTATIGSLIRMPIRFERVYSEYQVDGGEGLPPGRPIALPQPRPGAVAGRPPRRRPLVRAEVRTGDRVATTDSGVAYDSAGNSRVFKRVERDGDEERTIEIVLPRDPGALAESPYVPHSLFEEGGQVASEADLRALARAVGPISGRSPMARTALRWAPRDLTMLRYNRVEGLSFGARLDAERGPLVLDATGRLGWADLVPNAELGLARTTTAARYRVAAYSRLASVDAAARPLGIGNSLSAALFGRDDGDYFRAHGMDVTGAPAPARRQWYSWRAYAEAQRAATQETDVSVRRLWDQDHRFRPMVSAARADQLGASLSLRGQRGADPSRLVLVGDLLLEGSTGSADFARGSLTTRAAFRLPFGVRTAMEAAAGSALGDVPPQSLWYLGGPGTLRGYAGAAAAGDAFWRARLDFGTSMAAARLALFGDAGWAGSRADFADNAPFAGKPLLSWGVGASFLDGLVRLDFARGVRRPAGWRVDLYWDGAL